MEGPFKTYSRLRRGLEFGFFRGQPIVYGDVEPTCIDAQMGKGKFTRFLGVNLVSPRTMHFSKIITDPKDGELAWTSWKTLQRQGYDVRFLNTGDLYGYKSIRYNPNTRVLEIAKNPHLAALLQEAAYDAASYHFPIDPNPTHRWIGQGVRTMGALYIAATAKASMAQWPCTPGGMHDFFLRGRDEIYEDLLLWASFERLTDQSALCRQVASWTASPDQWNAYGSLLTERLQMYSKGSAARFTTDETDFDPASMKTTRTALYLMGSARSDSSRHFVGAMTSAIIERFADAHGDLRALVIGEEWGQLYVSNFYEILTLYRSLGINFLGVFQNAPAQIESRYGREVLAIWKKAAAITLYRGLPDTETLKDLEFLSGKTSVMVRGFSVNNAQVNGSGDQLSEQSRPLLQIEDLRALTSGQNALLHVRDHGFFCVDAPNFWERPEMSGLLRDTRDKPDRHAHLHSHRLKISMPTTDPDADIEAILARLRGGGR